MSLCSDLQGRLWVGTEDKGVWMWDPRSQKTEAGQSVEPQSHENTNPRNDPGKAGLGANIKDQKSTARDSFPGWTHFTRANTGGPPEPLGPVLSTGTPAEFALGDDNAYALACDRLGRIWVGNLNHGVSVYDGRAPEKDANGHFRGWRNYDVLTGPLGERVFAIKTSPVDGSVWICTSAGIARYRLNSDTWTYYTRADGLPSDQIQCLAFARDGTVYLGTQCDGVVIGHPVPAAGATTSRDREEAVLPSSPRNERPQTPDSSSLEYPAWRQVTTPNNTDAIPWLPVGFGLPSNLSNDILVAQDGSIFVATTTGLARSIDQGQTWTFLRGQDWEAKDRGLYHPPTKAQLDAARKIVPREPCTLLSEDYVTCLAQDAAGNLWVGHRQTGFEIFSLRSGERIYQSVGSAVAEHLPTDYVTALLTTGAAANRPVVGFYGGGLTDTGLRLVGNIPRPPTPALSVGSSQSKIENQKSKIPPLPSPAKPPTAAELVAMLQRLRAIRPEKGASQPLVVALPDDWRTEGRWIDCHGRFAAVLCAMAGGGGDYLGGYDAAFIQCHGAIAAPKNRPHDQIRRWVHWIRTENPRSLQNPSDGGRKQAEWDDHGETFPRTLEGPDLYGVVVCPPGRYTVALYFMNKDGHTDANRCRDYEITVQTTALPRDALARIDDSGTGGDQWFGSAASTAHGRVRDFAGGVYKRFYVNTGSTGAIVFRIARQGSLNTILSGIFLDPVGDLCGLEGPISQPAPRRVACFGDKSPETGDGRCDLALELLDRLLCLRDTHPVWYLGPGRRYLRRAVQSLLLWENSRVRAPEALYWLPSREAARADLAAGLHDLQLFAVRDAVRYPSDAYERFTWQQRTALGLQAAQWKWKWADFRAFVRTQQDRQTW